MEKEFLHKKEDRIDDSEAQTISPTLSELPQETEIVLTAEEPYPLELLRERLAAYEKRMAEQQRQWNAEKEESRRSFIVSRKTYFAPTITTASADSLRESVAEVDPTV